MALSAEKIAEDVAEDILEATAAEVEPAESARLLEGRVPELIVLDAVFGTTPRIYALEASLKRSSAALSPELRSGWHFSAILL